VRSVYEQALKRCLQLRRKWIAHKNSHIALVLQHVIVKKKTQHNIFAAVSCLNKTVSNKSGEEILQQAHLTVDPRGPQSTRGLTIHTELYFLFRELVEI